MAERIEPKTTIGARIRRERSEEAGMQARTFALSFRIRARDRS
jgi:hypothetical protein